ncbi:hypothetical protein HXX76_011485 [Chlamydomonas incerta]|uniref:Uncharacterized protein n=1 Tax=Chlamydomonas incerta TaxID=51695 RepID=A0A835VUW2_CHLIN|nr:hypothetical protein HXX76_011485 [Chlamydomonas incerta]|eukprot:KAG2428785.1 hypothetical protein HXX76_011485 [Chlamydomonas incerta]
MLRKDKKGDKDEFNVDLCTTALLADILPPPPPPPPPPTASAWDVLSQARESHSYNRSSSTVSATEPGPLPLAHTPCVNRIQFQTRRSQPKDGHGHANEEEEEEYDETAVLLRTLNVPPFARPAGATGNDSGRSRPAGGLAGAARARSGGADMATMLGGASRRARSVTFAYIFESGGGGGASEGGDEGDDGMQSSGASKDGGAGASLSEGTSLQQSQPQRRAASSPAEAGTPQYSGSAVDAADYGDYDRGGGGAHGFSRGYGGPDGGSDCSPAPGSAVASDSGYLQSGRSPMGRASTASGGGSAAYATATPTPPGRYRTNSGRTASAAEYSAASRIAGVEPAAGGGIRVGSPSQQQRRRASALISGISAASAALAAVAATAPGGADGARRSPSGSQQRFLAPPPHLQRYKSGDLGAPAAAPGLPGLAWSDVPSGPSASTATVYDEFGGLGSDTSASGGLMVRPEAAASSFSRQASSARLQQQYYSQIHEGDEGEEGEPEDGSEVLESAMFGTSSLRFSFSDGRPLGAGGAGNRRAASGGPGPAAAGVAATAVAGKYPRDSSSGGGGGGGSRGNMRASTGAAGFGVTRGALSTDEPRRRTTTTLEGVPLAATPSDSSPSTATGFYSGSIGAAGAVAGQREQPPQGLASPSRSRTARSTDSEFTSGIASSPSLRAASITGGNGGRALMPSLGGGAVAAGLPAAPSPTRSPAGAAGVAMPALGAAGGWATSAYSPINSPVASNSSGGGLGSKLSQLRRAAAGSAQRPASRPTSQQQQPQFDPEQLYNSGGGSSAPFVLAAPTVLDSPTAGGAACRLTSVASAGAALNSAASSSGTALAHRTVSGRGLGTRLTALNVAYASNPGDNCDDDAADDDGGDALLLGRPQPAGPAPTTAVSPGLMRLQQQQQQLQAQLRQQGGASPSASSPSSTPGSARRRFSNVQAVAVSGAPLPVPGAAGDADSVLRSPFGMGSGAAASAAAFAGAPQRLPEATGFDIGGILSVANDIDPAAQATDWGPGGASPSGADTPREAVEVSFAGGGLDSLDVIDDNISPGAAELSQADAPAAPTAYRSASFSRQQQQNAVLAMRKQQSLARAAAAGVIYVPTVAPPGAAGAAAGGSAPRQLSYSQQQLQLPQHALQSPSGTQSGSAAPAGASSGGGASTAEPASMESALRLIRMSSSRRLSCAVGLVPDDDEDTPDTEAAAEAIRRRQTATSGGAAQVPVPAISPPSPQMRPMPPASQAPSGSFTGQGGGRSPALLSGRSFRSLGMGSAAGSSSQPPGE